MSSPERSSASPPPGVQGLSEEYQLITDLPQPRLPTQSHYHLKRETTASWLALGVGAAFAVVLLAACGAHIYTLISLSEPPKDFDPAHLEALLKWRHEMQLASSSFTQTIGTLLAGPLGVVLGFYFRDRSAA